MRGAWSSCRRWRSQLQQSAVVIESTDGALWQRIDYSSPDCLTDVIDDTHQRAIVKAQHRPQMRTGRACTTVRRQHNDSVLWTAVLRSSVIG